MKKKLLMGGGVILGIIAIVIVILLMRGTSASQENILTDSTYKEARVETPDSKPCEANDDKVRISSQERSDIEMTAISYLIDVPAGTNVDVRLASVSNDTVSGSAIYPDEFGKYNFTAVKQSENAANTSSTKVWRLTAFKPCNE
jgi:hypothetical protein